MSSALDLVGLSALMRLSAGRPEVVSPYDDRQTGNMENGNDHARIYRRSLSLPDFE